MADQWAELAQSAAELERLISCDDELEHLVKLEGETRRFLIHDKAALDRRDGYGTARSYDSALEGASRVHMLLRTLLGGSARPAGLLERIAKEARRAEEAAQEAASAQAEGAKDLRSSMSLPSSSGSESAAAAKKGKILGMHRSLFVLALALVSTLVSSLLRVPGVIVIGLAAIVVFWLEKRSTARSAGRRRKSQGKGGAAEAAERGESFGRVMGAAGSMYRCLAACVASLRTSGQEEALEDAAREALSAVAEAAALLEAAIMPEEAVRAMAGAEADSPSLAAVAEAAARGASSPEEQERLMRELLEAVSSTDDEGSASEEEEEGEEEPDEGAGGRGRPKRA
eukprot:tig00020610_g12003.t1